MAIFQQIDPPQKQARNAINRDARWYTWSPDFRETCQRLTAQLDNLERPKSIRLLGGKEYDNTYSVEITSLKDQDLRRNLVDFGLDLYHLPISEEIMFFRDLLGAHLSGQGLNYLFAFWRSVIAQYAQDSLAALSQPLYRQSREPTAFPLHADLYVPQILFNVFEEVPNDSTGASLFMPVSTFVDILHAVKSLNERARQRMIEIIRGTHDRDYYEEFFHLLHGDGNEWRDELEQCLASKTRKIKLYAGQGYLISDRMWLHGREAPSGGVTRRRLHRLIFNTRPHDSTQPKLCLTAKEAVK